jgi:hypothetical protein
MWKAKTFTTIYQFQKFHLLCHSSSFLFLTSLFKSSLSKWSLKLKIKNLFNCSSTFHIAFRIEKWSQIKIKMILNLKKF